MKFSLKPRHLFLCVSGIGTAALCYLAGAVSLHYGWQPAAQLNPYFQAVAVWQDRAQAEQTVVKKIPSYNALLEEAKTDWDKSRAYNGYTLLNVRYQNAAILIDMEGRKAHQWALLFDKVFENPSHIQNPVSQKFISWDKTQALPNGDLLVTFIARHDTPYGYGLAKLDKNSKLLWAYAEHVHHEFYVSPDSGHIFILTQDFIDTPIAGLETLKYPLLSDTIVELSPEGKELRKVSLLEAFAHSDYKSLLVEKRPYGFDWDRSHTNSIMQLEPGLADAFPQFAAGQLLLSIRNIDTLAILDMDAKQISWATTGPWKAQHSSHFSKNGTIILFDNRGYFNGKKMASRILSFNPKTLATTSLYGTKAGEAFFSFAYGQVAELPNQNLLVSSSLESRLFEVAPDGKIVWQFKLPKKYVAIEPRLPPFKKGGGINPEVLGMNYNLATAIVSAQRYAPEQLPFLQEGIE